ncbi:MAG: transposase [Deltaproteobacteria bacterium]
MKEATMLEALGQVGDGEAGEIFRGFIREAVRSSFIDVMLTEVETLCGPSYRPLAGNAPYRSGSAPGVCILEGRSERVDRPRVRRKTAEGSKEVHLESYAAAKEAGAVREALLRAFAANVSGRDQKRLYPESPLTSKSYVSRLWVKEGLKKVEELRGRELSGESFFGLMLDGIKLSDDLTVVVAIGMTCDGRKLVLDFQIGGSENREVCDDLLRRIVSRGFKPVERLYTVLDGSASLKGAVLVLYPDAVTQRCLIHKERNIRGYLSKRHYSELAGYFRRLRNAQGPEAAREIYGELHAFLAAKNANALQSLEEAGEDIIALHLIDAPATLNVSLLSTNFIENSFRNVRAKIGRVKRWRAETGQAERWLAYGLLEAERGFRRMRGYEDIPKLVEKLKKSELPAQKKAA